MGFNCIQNGQLGLYHFDPIAEPQYLEYVGQEKTPCPPIRDIYCGGDYSFILTMDHKIYGFGKNKIGQLGIGDLANPRVCVPTKVNIQMRAGSQGSSSCSEVPGENLPVKLISCGWQSSFILFENEHIYVCGDNSNQCNVHQQQNSNYKPFVSPQRKQEKFSFQRIEIPNLYAKIGSAKNKIKDIQVGLFHTGILMDNGEVWISCPCCCSPIELERRKFKKKSFMDKNGKLITAEYGDDLLKSFKIMHMAYLSTLLCTHNDVMYVSGINYCGSLGVGTEELKAYKRFTESPMLSHIDVDSIYGTNRTILVTKKGDVYVCGSNCQGELCLDPRTTGKNKGLSHVESTSDETPESSCPCGNGEHCLRSCIETPQRVLFLENEVRKRRNAKLQIACGSFHTIAYFISTESKELTSFYHHLFSVLERCNTTVDHGEQSHGFSDISFNYSTKRILLDEEFDNTYESSSKKIKSR